MEPGIYELHLAVGADSQTISIIRDRDEEWGLNRLPLELVLDESSLHILLGYCTIRKRKSITGRKRHRDERTAFKSSRSSSQEAYHEEAYHGGFSIRTTLANSSRT
jgi:hypothetical protein